MIAYILSKLNVIKNRILRISNNMYDDLYGDGSLGNYYYGVDGVTPNLQLPKDYKQVLNTEGVWAESHTSFLRDKSLCTPLHPAGTVKALHYFPVGKLNYNNLWIGPNTMLCTKGDWTIVYVKDTLTIENGWICSNSTHPIAEATAQPSYVTNKPKLQSLVDGYIVVRDPNFIYTGSKGSGGNIFVYYNTAKSGEDILRLKNAESIKTFLEASKGCNTSTLSGGCLIICAKHIVFIKSGTLTPRIEAIGGDGSINNPGLVFETRCKPIGD